MPGIFLILSAFYVLRRGLLLTLELANLINLSSKLVLSLWSVLWCLMWVWGQSEFRIGKSFIYHLSPTAGL